MRPRKKRKLTDAERIALLKQANKMMPFVQNVTAPRHVAPPKGWKLLASSDPQQGDNGLFAKIYERTTPAAPGEPKYVVAFRGTRFNDLNDLNADLDILFLRVPRQYAQAMAFVQKTCKDNSIDPKDMDFTGHSLGGYLARTVGTALGARHIWTFNAPGPSRKVAQKLEEEIPGISASPGDRLVQVRTANDLVSVWGYRAGITISLNMNGRPHNLKNLAAAIKDAINGKPLIPVALPPKGSLTAAFDKLVGKIARARVTKNIVKLIFNNAAARAQKPAPKHPPYGPPKKFFGGFF